MQYCISHNRNVSVWMANDSNTGRLISNEIALFNFVSFHYKIIRMSKQYKENVFKNFPKGIQRFLLCNVIYCSPFIEITYHNNYKHTEGMTTYVFPF